MYFIRVLVCFLIAGTLHATFLYWKDGKEQHKASLQENEVVEIELPPEEPPPPPPPEDPTEFTDEPLEEAVLRPSLAEPPASVQTALTQRTIVNVGTQINLDTSSLLVDSRKISSTASTGAPAAEDITFDISDLDQKPSELFRPDFNAPSLLRSARPRDGKDKLRTEVTWEINPKGETNRIVRFDHDESATPAERNAIESELRRAIMRIRFTPGLKNGRAVRFKIKQPFVFSIGPGR